MKAACKGYGWVVMRDGVIASRHRASSGARRAAGYDGLVLAHDVDAFGRDLGLRVGDRVRDFGGQVVR